VCNSELIHKRGGEPAIGPNKRKTKGEHVAYRSGRADERNEQHQPRAELCADGKREETADQLNAAATSTPQNGVAIAGGRHSIAGLVGGRR
jgi:hypothetical protein